MNEAKRDQLIMETHAAVTSLKFLAERHDETLYGDPTQIDNPSGLVATVQAMRRTQEECPARISFTHAEKRERKRMSIAVVMMAIAILGLMTTVVLGVLNYSK